MRLISFHHEGLPGLGVQHPDGRTWSSATLAAGLPVTMAELLAAGDPALDALRAAAASAGASGLPGNVPAEALLAPVPRPGKVVAVGLNYHAHAAEGGAAIPASPMLFAKFPTAVVGPGATVEWDPELTSAVDLEAELAVVIGRTARRVSETDGLDHVLGYTCLNDVSARDLQYADRQFVRSKSLDTFCPMGPVLVTRDEIPDPGQLAVRSYRNGELMQDGHTSDLIFGVAALVAFCSRAFTLEPGDVIATGTPAGVGYFREPRVVMRDGDVMTVEVEGIGRLENPCREVRHLEVRPA
jgi:2-keto-4-pentenoate hydratase/2-oxohepta-3-ene-1,7-dioic acid hydratase in catechol pathway